MTPIIEPDDDAPVGRVLSRREVLGLLAGLSGVALLAACDPGQPGPAQPTSAAGAATQTARAQAVATVSGTPLNADAATAVAATPTAITSTAVAAMPGCVVKPELTAGPYFVDVALDRSVVRSDTSTGTLSEGVPLSLAFVVSQVASNACTPLDGAQVDIWHCDAAGVYSSVQGSAGTNFLRGYQVTDASGKATFTSVYPGCYSGRAVDIHLKIRTMATGGAAYEFTSQLFMDEAVTNKVYTRLPYASKGAPNVSNSRDNIYRSSGDQLLLIPTEANGAYSATFNIALDLSDAQVAARDSAGGGGRLGGRHQIRNRLALEMDDRA